MTNVALKCILDFRSVILCELLYKLVLFCDIVRVGKNSYCEFDKLIREQSASGQRKKQLTIF